MHTVNYFIDGINISDYGVMVANSDGILSRPKLKAPMSVKWETEHGENVDLNNKYYEPRDITLECFIVADSNEEFIRNSNAFCQIFDKKGTRRLSVNVDSSEPLVFEVYLMDGIEFKKAWRDGQVVGTFTLKLREPEPVKRVYKYACNGDDNKTANLAITPLSNKLFNVHWGDGKHTYNYDATTYQGVVTHNYTSNGTFYIIITGDIDTIDSVTTNATLVWTRL